ncbi:hypothetical protein SAMN05444408_104159 [Chryseobacterium takakiae]|uniref:Uncharacterized protein n=1 Tax=Chryseobacterium takakiae TaxID=1302685 RepID=A0A1M4WF92_9FLAO|nr:hypothetical protein SAMN05444408_104159 [Chryseobacterium takakiae]
MYLIIKRLFEKDKTSTFKIGLPSGQPDLYLFKKLQTSLILLTPAKPFLNNLCLGFLKIL